MQSRPEELPVRTNADHLDGAGIGIGIGMMNAEC